ncbi:hypothetical protein ACHAXS_003068 [Conticribra weissflogii]
MFPAHFIKSKPLFAGQDRNEGDDANAFVECDKEKKTTPRGRFRKTTFNLKANENSNVAAKLLESAFRFLFRPILFPLNFGKRRSGFPSVPLFYVLAVISCATIVPFITWVMLAVFFTIYLSLGMALMDEYDNLGVAIDNSIDNQNEEGNFFEQEGEGQKVVPLASFVGALVSAGLLSPRGLISVGGALSLTSPTALLTLAIGFVAIIGGICGVDEMEKLWEDNDVRKQFEKNERRRMNQWDEELKKK